MKNKATIIILIAWVLVVITGCGISKSYSKSVKKINGSSTCWTGEKDIEYVFKEGQSVKFIYDSKLKSGELSIVFLNPDKEVIEKFEMNKKDNVSKKIEKDGTYIVRVKAIEFNGNYSMEWKISRD